MIRGGLFALVALTLALTLGVAKIGEARIAYVPSSFYTATLPCPAGSHSRTTGPLVSQFERDWYVQQWLAAQEPSLYLASLDPRKSRTTTYRFTWLRSFHAPVFVRIDELPTGQMRLTGKHLSGEGGYGPGSIDKQVVRVLTPAEQADFRALLARTNVVNLPAKSCDPLGTDGSVWIVESSGPTGYRFINRWTPDTGPVREAGLAFLNLTGWKLGPIY